MESCLSSPQSRCKIVQKLEKLRGVVYRLNNGAKNGTLRDATMSVEKTKMRGMTTEDVHDDKFEENHLGYRR